MVIRMAHMLHKSPLCKRTLAQDKVDQVVVTVWCMEIITPFTHLRHDSCSLHGDPIAESNPLLSASRGVDQRAEESLKIRFSRLALLEMRVFRRLKS
jgi:hypothetical protein